MILDQRRKCSKPHSTPNERIGQAVKNIRRKHGRAAIRFGHEGIANALAVFGKRPTQTIIKTDGAQ